MAHTNIDLISFFKCVNPYTLLVLIVYVSRSNVSVRFRFRFRLILFCQHTTFSNSNVYKKMK